MKARDRYAIYKRFMKGESVTDLACELAEPETLQERIRAVEDIIRDPELRDRYNRELARRER